MKRPRVLGLFCVLFVGCGGGSGLSWEGETEHVVVSGFLNGEDVELRYTDADAVAVELSCVREYEVPFVNGASDPTMTVNVENEIQGRVEINGEVRFFQVELKRHDAQGEPLETPLTIVPRDDLNPPDVSGDEIWVEWEWQDADGSDLYEQSAQSGTVTFHAFTGTRDPATGLIPEGEGVIGVTIDAYWSPQERLQISLTAPCVENDVEVLAP